MLDNFAVIVLSPQIQHQLGPCLVKKSFQLEDCKKCSLERGEPYSEAVDWYFSLELTEEESSDQALSL